MTDFTKNKLEGSLILASTATTEKHPEMNLLDLNLHKEQLTDKSSSS